MITKTESKLKVKGPNDKSHSISLIGKNSKTDLTQKLISLEKNTSDQSRKTIQNLKVKEAKIPIKMKGFGTEPLIKCPIEKYNIL